MGIQGREPAIKVIAMPADSNPDGDVFGGWILSMMDLAGASLARRIARNRTVTVAIDNIIFHKPVLIGDYMECYADLVKIGNTSVTIMVETHVIHRENGNREKVTEGKFVYVSIDQNRRPVKIEQLIG